MLPDWVEYTKAAVEVIGTLGGVALAYTRLVYRLGQQDGMLKRIAQGNEWNNEVTELMAKKTGTIPSDPPGPSDSNPPPPRPKVATLNDPFEAVMDEAAEKARTEG